jgi:effector-binding domain-containing protein
MKIMRKILIGIVVLLSIIMLANIFLPGTVVVKRSRVMPISKESAYENIAVLQNWKNWMTWAKLDPNAAYTYSSEPANKVGDFYTWKGNKDMGEGKMTIKEIYGTDSIRFEIDFAGQGISPVIFNIASKGDSTEVTWTMKFDFPFYARFMGFMMDGVMGKDFEEGLAGIEKIGLAQPVGASKSQFSVEDSKPMMCLTMLDSCTVDPKIIGDKYNSMFGQLDAEMKAQKLSQAGAPFAVTIKYDMNNNFMVFSPGIPVSAEVKDVKNKKIKFAKYDAQKCLVYNYYGDYSTMQASYEAMYKHIGENKMEVAGYSWEEYITDPMVEKDTAKWLTKIYIPIK